MKKRFLTLALVLAVCLSLAIPAFADDAAKPEDKDPVATESVKPEDKDSEPSESAEPTDKPEDKDPEPSESAGEPEDKDPEPSEPAAPQFTDVPEGAYFETPVAWAVEKKITNGTEPGTFAPEDTCSRVQILTFLYRAVQSAEDPDFAPTSNDLLLAAKWALEKGMIGDAKTINADCTRADAVNYIWQAFGKAEAENKAEFTDVDADADYAEAVSWAVEKKITNGDGSDTIFNPGKTCTRGQIVTFLYRAYNPADTEPADPDSSDEPTVSQEPTESISPAPTATPEAD